LGDKAKQSRK
jgi:hypothetical protein